MNIFDKINTKTKEIIALTHSDLLTYTYTQCKSLKELFYNFASTLEPKKIGSFLSQNKNVLNQKIEPLTDSSDKISRYSFELANIKNPSPLELITKEIHNFFPESMDQIRVINSHIGGSTGAKLVEDRQKRQYVQKTSGEGTKIKPNHLKSEYYTNKAYKALGVKVPEVALYNSITGKLVPDEIKQDDQPLVMLSKFIPGKTLELQNYLELYPERLEEVKKLVQKHFVADCLLANWDVVGLTFDNIRIDLDTKEIWRVDNGSGLDYRAQGGLKGDLFADSVGELETLRNPSINRESSILFSSISNEEIISQIDEILPLREQFLETIPAHLKAKMTKRFEFLRTYKDNLLI